MQYKVPQNIDIEDKVIGSLTLKQFIYLIVAFGTLMIIRYSLPSAISFLFVPLVVIIGGFFLALAFYRPGDRAFEIYLFSILTTITKPRKRVWKKIPYKKNKEETPKKNIKVEAKNVSSEDLERLAFVVDSGGFEEELKNKGFITAMQETKKLAESSDLGDTLSASETPRKDLQEMLLNAKTKVSKEEKEPSIQEMASINPDKTFEYKKLPETANKKEFKNLLELSKKRQEERFEEAKITR